MKKTFITIVALFIILTSAIYLAACNDTTDEGVETPPASDESNNEQESAEDPSYNEILVEKITVSTYGAMLAMENDQTYPRRRYLFTPRYTSDYEIRARVGQNGTFKISEERQNVDNGLAVVDFRMEKGKEYSLEIFIDSKANYFGICVNPKLGFDGITLSAGEEYMVMIDSEEREVKRYISQNPSVRFTGVYKMDINCNKFVVDTHSGSMNLSSRCDVLLGSTQRYVVVKNISDTAQTLDVAETEIESVNLDEEFEIDWKNGEGYYFVKYEETGIGTSYKMRSINLSTSEFRITVIAAQGSTSGYTAGPGLYFLPLIDGIYYIGFMFNPENTYAIKIT